MNLIMTQCELALELSNTTSYVYLILGFFSGFLLSMFLVSKAKKKPKFIDFCTDQGIKRLYRIGQHYYTKEDFDKNLDARKVYGEI